MEFLLFIIALALLPQAIAVGCALLVACVWLVVAGLAVALLILAVCYPAEALQVLLVLWPVWATLAVAAGLQWYETRRRKEARRA